MMVERRRHVRFPFERHLQVRADPPVGRIVVDAKDVSESGLSFTTNEKLVVGDLIVLGLQNDDFFLVEATVRNVRQEGDHFIVGAERSSH
jgi:PilZ domain